MLRQPAVVATFMVDFEAALWRTIAAEFPDVVGLQRD